MRRGDFLIRPATALLIAGCMTMSTTASALTCDIDIVHIEAERSTAYVVGMVASQWRRLYLCPGGPNDCDSRSTEIRMSIALTAFTTGMTLSFYTADYTACADVPDWWAPASFQIKP